MRQHAHTRLWLLCLAFLMPAASRVWADDVTGHATEIDRASRSITLADDVLTLNENFRAQKSSIATTPEAGFWWVSPDYTDIQEAAGDLRKATAMICSGRNPAFKNGQVVPGLFYAGCFDQLASPGHWEVNVCPTTKFSDARFQCSKRYVNGQLVYLRCGCGLNEGDDDVVPPDPKYEPEFSVPVDLAPGQSVSITIKSQ